MFGRLIAGGAALALVGAAPPVPQLDRVPMPAGERLEGPDREQGSKLASDCKDKDGWSDPAPPVRIDANTYYVGTCGISVLLVVSKKGHVLIDAGPNEAAPLVLANIRQLGFNPRDVKWLLASHAHFDHVGGMAALQKATGARIAALPDQARELQKGVPLPDDPQFGAIHGFAAVKVDRTLTDGTALAVGTNRLTPVSTPGHTRGSTSWIIETCSGGCSVITYADSLSAVSADAYRFSDHPDWTAMFRRGITRVGDMRCEVLVTPHPSASNLFARLAANPQSAANKVRLHDDGACSDYANKAWKALDQRLAQERADK